MYLDKKTVAKYMIHCGIRNVFAGECPVSNHVIILSAKEVVQDLAKAAGVVLQADISRFVKDQYRKDFVALMKSRYNFFKHADRDHDEEIEITNIQFSNEADLFFVIVNWGQLFGQWTKHMQTFMMYMMIGHPNWFDLDALPEQMSGTAKTGIAEFGKQGRRSLCETLYLVVEQDPEMRRERAEVKEMSFAASAEATEKRVLKGSAFSRKKA